MTYQLYDCGLSDELESHEDQGMSVQHTETITHESQGKERNFENMNYIICNCNIFRSCTKWSFLY